MIPLSGRLGPLLLAGALAVLAGCGASDPTANASDEVPTTAAPTEVAASPAPSLPRAAKSHGKSGAEATAEYWFAALTYAQQTGDLTPVKSVSSEDCRGCTQLITSLRSAFGGGGSVVGGGYTVREMTDEEYSEAVPLLNVVFDRDALSIVGTGGATMQTVPASAFQQARVLLKWTGTRWLVADITGLTPLGGAG